MGRKKREIKTDLDISKEAKHRIFVRELRKQGVIASEAFKILCEQGVTFDRAFEIVSEEYGVGLIDVCLKLRSTHIF
jgi:hypothetical protein